MHMIDVMAKLKDIAESGYDNEDIQRGIDAAATQNYEVSEEDNKLVSEISVLASSDAVEEVHEDVEEDTILADMLKLAGRSGVMGLSQNNIIAESLELDEEEVREDTQENEVKRVIAKVLGTYRPLTDDDFDNADLNSALYDYFSNSGDMPYDTAKARDGDPNEWIFDKLYSLGMTEAVEEVEEAEEVGETVAVPVQALEELMRLAGYENYEAKIDEYENAPEPEYMDAEEQLIGLSGGLNGPKKAYAAAAGGDNAMAQEPREVEETIEESFYSDYSKMVEELKAEDE